jgi:hypothetical protein
MYEYDDLTMVNLILLISGSGDWFGGKRNGMPCFIAKKLEKEVMRGGEERA